MQDEQSNNKETKLLSPDEQQELINKSEQILANFQKLDSEIKFSSRDFQNQFSTVKHDIKGWLETSKSLSNTLEKNLNTLAKEITILCSLPDKIGERLVQIIPDISTQVSTNMQKKMFEDYTTVLANTNKAVYQLNEKIRLAIKKAEDISTNALKRKLAYLVLVLSITIFASTGLTYAIMQRFPKIVRIDTKGDITIDGGSVSIWGTGKNTVQPSKKS
jgi:hypothetical protein